MNILFIHEVDWLNKVVFDIHTLAESLSLRSHKVYAIDYEDTWRRDGAFDLGTLKTREFDSVSRAFVGSSVFLRRPGFIRISGLSRVSAAFTHNLEIKRTLKQKDIDAIILYSVATNGLQTVSIAKRLNIPVIFRSIDILNQLAKYPYLRPITKILERIVYPRVDMILTLTPSLSRYVVELGATERKVKLLPMPVDTNIFYPYQTSDDIRHKWGINKEEMVILYIGTLFDFSGLDLVIRQFPEINRQVPSTKLLIVGDGPQHRTLEEIISKTGQTDKVIITGFQPYETMPQYINTASICLNPFLITGATKDIFPGKIVQYLACAKAVIATPLPGLIAVAAGEDQGLVYYNTMEEMTEQVITLLKKPEQRERLERNGLEYIRKVHSCNSIAEQLESRLQEAINEKCMMTS